MSLPENPPGDTPGNPFPDSGELTTVKQLEAEIRGLRQLLNLVMFALILLITSLFAFMLREQKLVRRQIEENLRFVSEYKAKVEPRLNEFGSKLIAYSKLHSNFVPILQKYYNPTNAPGRTGVTSSISAPVATGSESLGSTPNR